MKYQMAVLNDLTGQRFGRLMARWPCGFQGKHVAWLCSCECGELKVVIRGNLINGSTKSCGCLHRIFHVTHGASYSRTYKSWISMKSRCSNKNLPCYRWYGGRGIKFAKRWRKFENFLADMGERPPTTSLDRFPDNDGDYKPGNCRWATPHQQMANKRKRRSKVAHG